MIKKIIPQYIKNYPFLIIWGIIFLIKKIPLEKTLSFWAQKIQHGQNLKSMIFMEKSSRVQLTFIFNHKYIHYIIFEHLSILRKFIFEKKR